MAAIEAAPDRLPEDPRADRLREELGDTKRLGEASFRQDRADDHRDSRGPLVGAQLGEDLPAVLRGQHDVERDDVGPLGAREVERGRRRPRLEEPVAGAGEVAAEEVDDVRVVVDDEDGRLARDRQSQEGIEIAARLAKLDRKSVV